MSKKLGRLSLKWQFGILLVFIQLSGTFFLLIFWQAIKKVEGLEKELPGATVEMLRSINQQFIFLFAIMALVGLTVLISWFLRNNMIKPAAYIREALNALKKGEFEPYREKGFSGEPGKLMDAFLDIDTRLKEVAKFARSIGKNTSDISLKPLGGKDLLAHSLLSLKNQLVVAREEEKKWKAEDQKRNWITQGLANLDNVLRKYGEDLQELCDQVLMSLIQYLGANQGGVFLLEEDDGDRAAYLKLVSAYAYNRKKFMQKTIFLGEGLTGTCALEKDSIFLTDIPKDYVEITSGLGGATPSSIFIVPLKKEDQLLGVIELASFKIFTPDQRELVEKLAGNIAATLYSVKINRRTSLLLEQSRKQSEELAQQEEEMRQNMEELQATQEEMEKKQEEINENQTLLKNIIDLVPFPVFVKNKDKAYLLANRAQQALWSSVTKDLVGCKDEDFIRDLEEINVVKKSDNEVLFEEKTIKLPEQTITFPDGTRRVLQTTKVPFVNNITKNRNILGVSIDYTEQRVIEKELQVKEKSLGVLREELNRKKELINELTGKPRL